MANWTIPTRLLAGSISLSAGVHSLFRHNKDENTGRLLDALANPHLDILAHPTSRLIGSREPLEMDFERVLGAAVKNGAALEINGSMCRLDLNDSMARAAQEAGVLLAIGSDAHNIAQLDQIRYGVFQARRGWIEARSVINTWAWTKLNRWLERRHSSLKKASNSGLRTCGYGS